MSRYNYDIIKILQLFAIIYFGTSLLLIFFTVENLKLTPYHPVMRGAGSDTMFPIDASHSQSPIAHDGYVYDFVLANRSILASPLQRVRSFAPNTTMPSQLRNDCLFAATFGHRVTQGCFAHAYFGSERVVNDLKRHARWSSGYISLDKYIFLRADAEEDPERRVVGMVLDFGSTTYTVEKVSTADLLL